MADLDQARVALVKLLPQLPQPQPIEQLDEGGVSIPKINCDSTALPVLESPQTLLANVGPLVGKFVPEAWKPAYFAYKHRLRRNAQLVRLHPLCQHSGPAQFADADGTVAGALLLCLRPMPGLVRDALLQRALTQPWGAFLAANGLVLPKEQPAILRCVTQDPRLAAALSRTNPELPGPLLEAAMVRTDLWSASMLLNHVQADQWLQRVVAQAATNEIAGATALTLQPSASPEIRSSWIARLRQPQLAYLTVRWTRHTWPPSRWQQLRDQFRVIGLGDRGSSWFHFHRDIEPERTDEALREENVDVLWQAELVHHARSYGQDLRRRMTIRLQSNGTDREAGLTLRWLNGRQRPGG